MLNKKVSVIFLSIVIFLSAFVGNAYAATVPTFPVCSNPQGTVKVSYDSGTHGVVGDATTYTGKDTVYTLSENTLTQCLCTTNGNGIQTNWWKASSLTQEEINVLVNEGWKFVQDGSAWGLSSAPYLAKNSTYSCTGGSGGTSDNNSSNSNSSNSVAGVTQAILALASTGNTMFILGVFLTGVSLFGAGIASSFKKRG
jgi:hypothetical protein